MIVAPIDCFPDCDPKLLYSKDDDDADDEDEDEDEDDEIELLYCFICNRDGAAVGENHHQQHPLTPGEDGLVPAAARRCVDMHVLVHVTLSLQLIICLLFIYLPRHHTI